jgi:hypothetical protein
MQHSPIRDTLFERSFWTMFDNNNGDVGAAYLNDCMTPVMRFYAEMRDGSKKRV